MIRYLWYIYFIYTLQTRIRSMRKSCSRQDCSDHFHKLIWKTIRQSYFRPRRCLFCFLLTFSTITVQWINKQWTDELLVLLNDWYMEFVICVNECFVDRYQMEKWISCIGQWMFILTNDMFFLWVSSGKWSL